MNGAPAIHLFLSIFPLGGRKTKNDPTLSQIVKNFSSLTEKTNLGCLFHLKYHGFLNMSHY
jgi:hypothetical protein